MFTLVYHGYWRKPTFGFECFNEPRKMCKEKKTWAWECFRKIWRVEAAWFEHLSYSQFPWTCPFLLFHFLLFFCPSLPYGHLILFSSFRWIAFFSSVRIKPIGYLNYFCSALSRLCLCLASEFLVVRCLGYLKTSMLTVKNIC